MLRNSILTHTLRITKVASLTVWIFYTDAKPSVIGKTRFDRLLLIGTSSTYLYPEALKAAVAEAKRGRDTGSYENAVTAFHLIIPDDPEAIPDLGWIDRLTKQTKSETDRLELELKGYKNNLIKESIRVSFVAVLRK